MFDRSIEFIVHLGMGDVRRGRVASALERAWLIMVIEALYY